jgi:hypothetical protein
VVVIGMEEPAPNEANALSELTSPAPNEANSGRAERSQSVSRRTKPKMGSLGSL